ncbi:hypothetical protein SAMN02746095_02116 [Acidocella aminolytica 101 = DSM 11237]|uniref:Uncharacterized protein n=2 Tax=Acidocella TaxID=50709 RepID=A0A0D6PJX2_9PROT|nr:hypothetical protein [Acidocella aminolytica]GAN81982.1 hypothetical protein Aam_135_002 [Acidocella aminolytica 101 = DSM 11237]GBQ34771.1 hypothetical protein AA11237_0820 [Acidocella aminolytica 101 = DSM 11237]SHF10194.1 hypothetical protein SAMN02746095_02116 [Acidocella aminolytica 101 = DSM 11237]
MFGFQPLEAIFGGGPLRRQFTANTVSARIAHLLKQHTTLTRPQIAVLLAAENAGEVPLGSISAALSKLYAEGWIGGGRMGWWLAGEDADAAE